MTTIQHINYGSMQVPPNPKTICHGLALVDTGIGLPDVQRRLLRLGQQLIGMVGLIFNEADTAVPARSRGWASAPGT